MCCNWMTAPLSVAEAHSTPSWKGLAAHIAEGSNLHERALQAVKSVSTPGKDEPETKEIIANVLRGYLLLENAALTGSEPVFVFGVAGKRFAFNHIANALRETWGNGDRFRSHDIALSQQLQRGHLAGVVHWGQEKKTIGKRRTTTTKTHWTMDITMVRHRRIRRRISSRRNRLDRGLLQD